MTTTIQLVESFHKFALERINDSAYQPSIDELFHAWRLENPMDDEYAENVAAINASIDDFKNGERGTPAGSHSNELQ